MEDKKQERVSVFIDGSNLYHSLKNLGRSDIDFKKLIDELVRDRFLVNVFYYIAPHDIKYNEEKYWKHQKFLDKLSKISKFNVVLCTMRKYRKNDGDFGFRVKGDDVYLANDLLVGAYEDFYDTAILVSGDEDFVPVVKTVQKLNKKVEDVYFSSSSSKKLRKTCNTSLNFKNIISKIL
jgi:uncharacterized LabA/DUF88 family protein